ncbi:hypothetical protein OIDMADRAFT_40836 [Oidiodendron maius Zn]|uniref:Major facilitator superfamily (MFS) profile domain-containing protein n=1 Tax=Oidiodendron maius (strain Zn) TaxID=913774 RepID=A0A0C3CW82_OIDMZ|nr:hypothetical protein OIDMADRAFT_40836 [Oidiodendron maius Zn]
MPPPPLERNRRWRGAEARDRSPNGSEASPYLRDTSRKIDLRLIPILGALYAISGIDRANLAVALLAGMGEELKFTEGSRYSIALLIFFVPYFIFEIPSNIILRRVGAARWLSFLSFGWGVSILGSGFARSWTVIVGIRILVGTFEAGFVPGCLCLISCWYDRYQVQKRISVFYAISLLAGGFGNILAYGAMKIHAGGFLGWRWIFIVEGLIPIALAPLGYWLIVDFPDKVHMSRLPFLTAEQVQITKDRLDSDRGDAQYIKVTRKTIFRVLRMWQIWVYSFQFMCAGIGVYAFAYFTPLILQGLGFNETKIYLLSAPPNIAAIPYAFGLSYIADKTKMRGPFVVLHAVVTLVGLMITAYTKQNAVRYFGIFLGTCGSNGNLPTILAWQANNIRGQDIRLVASGFQVAAGAIGGIYASTTFIEKQAPEYHGGIWATTAAQFALIASVALITIHHRRANKQADHSLVVLEGLEGFRYTY